MVLNPSKLKPSTLDGFCISYNIHGKPRCEGLAAHSLGRVLTCSFCGSRSIMPSPGPAGSASLEEFLLVTTPPPLLYSSFESSIMHFPLLIFHFTFILKFLIPFVDQPYKVKIFDPFLVKHNLLIPRTCPESPRGFLLGHMPDLHHHYFLPLFHLRPSARRCCREAFD